MIEPPEIDSPWQAMRERGAVARRQRKETDYTYVLATHYAIEQAIGRRQGRSDQPLLHFDLYAGAGMVELDGGLVIPGSPVIAANIFAPGTRPVWAYYFERDRDHAVALEANLERLERELPSPPGWRTRVLEGDHGETAPPLMDELWRQCANADGLVYADPYGLLPVELLQQFALRFARLDQLLCVTATGYKRFRTAASPRYLQRDVQVIGKRYAWVREPVNGDAWQQTMIFLTNWNGWPHLKQLGFWSLASPEGRALMDRLNYSKPELQAREQDE